MLAPIPADQDVRLAAIKRYDLGNGSHSGAFDGLAELASQICNCPIALVSIVRESDQMFESAHGVDLTGTGLNASICSHAILQNEILEISDLRLDLRTKDNPLVTDPDDPLLFYAGAQITTRDGIQLGSLCVLDRRPRRLGDAERRALRVLADQVMQRLELHEALRNQDAMRREVDHRVKNSLANVAAMTRMAGRGASEETREALKAVGARIDVMVALHEDLYRAEDPDAPIDVAAYLDRITSHLTQIAPAGVRVDVDLAPLALVARRASALGVLVNEMISNACKHAFPDQQSGSIRLTGQNTDDRYIIRCEDDGVGAGTTNLRKGLGQRIMEASASQLIGTLKSGPRDRGFEVEVSFPSNLN